MIPRMQTGRGSHVDDPSFLRMLVGAGAAAAVLVASPAAADQQRFPTAQAAMDALVQPLERETERAYWRSSATSMPTS